MRRGVAALAWAPQAAAIFAAGADRQVVRLGAGTGAVAARFDGGKLPLTALAVTPNASHAFAASSAVAAWQPLEQRRLLKFTGHPVGAASTTIYLTSTAQTLNAVESGRKIMAAEGAVQSADAAS